jgi:hypothetical protein
MRELFGGWQILNICQLAIDGSLEFKVESHAVDLASRLPYSLVLALVQSIDCGIVASFPSVGRVDSSG